jgi:uncharacterized protein
MTYRIALIACWILPIWLPSPMVSADDFEQQTHQWQKDREEKLRGENGWLTLVGRFPLQAGSNSFGVDAANDVVFPADLREIGPARLGTIDVNPVDGSVVLRLAASVAMTSEGVEFRGERPFRLAQEKRDWVSLGRMSMHVTGQDGNFFLRIADNQAELRNKFPGCQWYPPNSKYRVTARYVPYAQEKTLSIKNVMGDLLQQPCSGYAEFSLDGINYRLDAIREGEGLFFVFRDATAGESTYGGGRFIDIERRPDDNTDFVLDFNRAYNPPCAFSKYTTCPLPPPQNVLNVPIEAGEKLKR